MSKIGKVKWFNGTKGFGFIAVDGDEKDIFVHISAVKDSGIDSLVEGDTIEFEVEDGNKGPVAVQLKKQQYGTNMGLVNKQAKTKDKIRLVSNGNSLSNSDMELLKGTLLLEKMVRNRVVIVTNNEDISWKSLVDNISGLYHIKPLDKVKHIYQLWFELPKDIEQFKKNLYVSKLADTAHEQA